MKFTASIASVRRALNSPLPGEEAQYKMAPVQRKSKSEYLSEFPEHRMSSILILLYPDQNNEMQTVLIKRPDNQGAHSGQIAFPGGKLEPGETPEQAALREANEEVGVPVSQVELAGGLTSLFIPVSKFLVNPFVGIIEEAPGFVPNPDEVTMLLPTPVETILKLPVGETAVQTSYGALKTPYYDLNGHIIWGATAMIISEFRELLKSRV